MVGRRAHTVVLSPSGNGSIVALLGAVAGSDGLWYRAATGNYHVTGTASSATFPQTGCVNGCIAGFAQSVPEPSSVVLALTGLIALVSFGRRMRPNRGYR